MGHGTIRWFTDEAIRCRDCGKSLNNGNGHCGSDLCPQCWGERVNEDRDTYPIREDYEE